MSGRKHVFLRFLLMVIVVEVGIFLVTIIGAFVHPIIYLFWYVAALFSLTAAASWIGLDILEMGLKRTNEKWYKTKGARSSIAMLLLAFSFSYNGFEAASSNLSSIPLSHSRDILAVVLGPLLITILSFLLAIVSAIMFYRRLGTSLLTEG